MSVTDYLFARALPYELEKLRSNFFPLIVLSGTRATCSLVATDGRFYYSQEFATIQDLHFGGIWTLHFEIDDILTFEAYYIRAKGWGGCRVTFDTHQRIYCRPGDAVKLEVRFNDYTAC